MRHGYFGKKLSRSFDKRKQLLRSLSCDFIKHGTIQTTKAKAVAIRSLVEKMITKAKEGTQHSYRQIFATLGPEAAKTLVEESKTRFGGRTSGYTRILRLGYVGSDARNMVQLSFVDAKVVTEIIKPEVTNEKPKETKTEKTIDKKTARLKKTTKK